MTLDSPHSRNRGGEMDRNQAEPVVPLGMFRTLASWFRARSSQVLLSPSHPEISLTSAAQSRNQSTHVLVVDDNPCNLGEVSEKLQQCGISPRLASDGAEAVLLCSEVDFDLILMDLQMPVLDGLVATSMIRRDEALHARPAAAVVAFSSSGSTGGLLDAYGFSGILRKPCSLAQLEACLVRWCPNYLALVPGAVAPGAGPSAASRAGPAS